MYIHSHLKNSLISIFQTEGFHMGRHSITRARLGFLFLYTNDINNDEPLCCISLPGAFSREKTSRESMTFDMYSMYRNIERAVIVSNVILTHTVILLLFLYREYAICFWRPPVQNREPFVRPSSCHYPWRYNTSATRITYYRARKS